MVLKINVLKIISNKIFWALLLLLACCVIYLNVFSLQIKDAILIDATGLQTHITLPYLKDMPETEYTIRGNIFFNKFFSIYKAHIVVDDSLWSFHINQQGVNFNSEGEYKYTSGFHINLEKYLIDGTNTFECRIKNSGGLSGLIFEGSTRDIKVSIAGSLAILALMGIFCIILYYFREHKAVILILLGGLLVRLLYFMVTPYDTRPHDLYGHMSYIDYVTTHWTPPERYSGLQAHQPPLYYYLAALVYKAGEFLGVQSYYLLYRLVQFFSVLLSMGFLCFAYAIFKKLLTSLTIFREYNAGLSGSTGKPKQNWIILIMLGLITFWPSIIIHSARIGNDALLYFLYAGGLFFLVRWYFDNHSRDMYLAFIFATLSLLTKANALVLVSLCGIIYLWKFFLDKERNPKKYLIRTLSILLILTAGAWITLGEAINHRLKGSPDNFLVPNANTVLGGGLAVGNELKNYVWLDMPDFFTVPFADPSADAGGRQYFWNYLFKTGLTGEFHFETPFHKVLAILISYQFLCILLFTLAGLVIILRREWQEHLILFLNMIFLLVAAMLFRISIPASCSNDFRYILPILIAFCFFFGYAIFNFHRRGWRVLEFTGYALAGLFLVTSNLFMIGLLF